MLIPMMGFAVMTSTVGALHLHHTGDLSPEPYVKRALAASPELRAAQHRARAVAARADAAGALSDPVLSLSVNNLPLPSFSLSSTPMSGLKIGLSQRIPWPSKPGLQEETVAHRADARAAEISERSQNLAAQVRTLFYEVHFVDQAVQVIQKNLKIIEGFVQVADAKYRVGRGQHRSVLEARVIRGQLQTRALELKRKRESLRIRMNSLLAIDAHHPLPSLLHVAVTPLQGLDPQVLFAQAELHNPRLRRLTAQLRAHEKAQARAALEAIPDLSLSVGYTVRLTDPARDPVNGADFLSVSAAIPLPVWYAQKQGPMARAAAQETLASRRSLEAERREIREAIEAALVQIPQLSQQMEQYRTTIIPLVQQTLEADQTAYQVDKIDVLDLLNIEMRLLNFEVDYHRLHAVREQQIVGLARAVGVPPARLGRLP